MGSGLWVPLETASPPVLGKEYAQRPRGRRCLFPSAVFYSGSGCLTCQTPKRQCAHFAPARQASRNPHKHHMPQSCAHPAPCPAGPAEPAIAFPLFFTDVRKARTAHIACVHERLHLHGAMPEQPAVSMCSWIWIAVFCSGGQPPSKPNRHNPKDKATPAARRVRKATGLHETAEPPEMDFPGSHTGGFVVSQCTVSCVRPGEYRMPAPLRGRRRSADTREYRTRYQAAM